MKTTELRLGNKILFSEDGTIATVKEISLTGVQVTIEQETTWIEIENFEGIKLTNELVEDFGLNWREYEPFGRTAYEETEELLRLDPGDGFYHFDFIQKDKYSQEPEDTSIICLAQIKYVHQLQNLYYALTGEELKLKAA